MFIVGPQPFPNTPFMTYVFVMYAGGLTPASPTAARTLPKLRIDCALKRGSFVNSHATLADGKKYVFLPFCPYVDALSFLPLKRT